ncbi:hypothetical protein [Nannocystis punicea]|uniref:Uncharacterized protein n=1 Tax=Nannocystis punicea TaxID=2995304 RepID=A0ABY7HIV1_9BACT|nr:hypothetical protein [Nannocystis poenicansa]WAS99252.1 hypothetical protein O0S08_24250 [Nannocystis poenicansa]
MRALLWLSIVALVLAGIGWCIYSLIYTDLEPVARRAFSAAHSCPEERLTARVRLDLDFFAMAFGPAAPAPEPPPEVRADPARLAVWESTRQQSAAGRDTWKDAGQVVEVEGCDRRQLYACFRWAETSTTSNMPLCNPVNPAFLPVTPPAAHGR